MKTLIILCLVAVAFTIECDNPMLNNKTNRLAPSQGILKNSTLAPEKLPVCKPLQGKEVCCEGPAWDELKANYIKVKGRFKKFVEKRRERIEKIEQDLNEDLVEEVSDILNDNQAMVKTDAFKMEYQKLKALGKKTKGGKDIKISPVQKKKYDVKGHEVCHGISKEECKKRIEKEQEFAKKREEEYRKQKEEWAKKREEWEKEKKEAEQKEEDRDLDRKRPISDKTCVCITANGRKDPHAFCKWVMLTEEKSKFKTCYCDKGYIGTTKIGFAEKFKGCFKNGTKPVNNDTKPVNNDTKPDNKNLRALNILRSLKDDREDERKEREEKEKEWRKEQEDKLKEADKKRKDWEKEQREKQEKLEKWDKKMSKDQEKKWKEEKEIAKKDFERQMKERKEKEKDSRDAKKKIAKSMRKMRRVEFIKHQAKCFKRLFKVTVGMMCMTCNANYKSYFMKTNGTWQIVMNQGVCNNLMKDCYPYLNHTNLQGRNMLDMKRMKKFQKNKAEIQKRLAAIKEKIAASDDQDAIVEALSNYQEKLTAAMKLKKEDFQGEGAEDFKYHFKMPLKCLNDTHCEWICQNMVKADGISDDAVNSTQNTKIEDLEADDNQQFETDLVIVDDSEEDDLDEDSTNITDDRPPVNARLLADETTIGLVYDVDGYQADDDTFEDGVIVSEPAMAEGLIVPEDQVAKYPSGGIPTWVFIVAGVALLVIVAGAVFACKSKQAPYTHNNGGQHEINMQDMRDTTMTQVI